MFKQSLHHEVLISLEKEPMGDAVEHPWERVLALPDNSKNILSADKIIIDVFDETDRFLLVLGEPGSGKTTTVFELASHLISRAENNPQEPVPVIFNLSSWTNNKRSLLEWLIGELKSKYKLGGKLAQSWLEGYRILPLLDGLDEVKSENLNHCIRAINDFISNSDYGTPGLVVCCRLQEYTSLSVRLKLNGAICLRPLTLEQVTNYLERLGPKLHALKIVIKENQTLQELSRSPLMLGIMSLAYQDMPLETIIGDEKMDSVKRRSKNLFEIYIERMFERKGRTKSPYSKEKVKMMLSWLAQKMREHSQSVFLIETLQATWLSTRKQKIVYDFGSGFSSVGLILGLILGLGEGVLEGVFDGLIGGGIGGLIGGLTAALVGPLNQSKEISIQKITLFLKKDFLAVLLFGLPVGLLVGVSEGVLEGLIGGGIGGLIGGLSLIATGCLDHDIELVETLSWSWNAFRKKASRGLIYGFLGVLVIGLSEVPIKGPVEEVIFWLLEWLLGGLMLGLLGGLCLGLIGGLEGKMIQRKTFPNQGISLSLKNGIIWGLIVGLLVGLIVGLIVGVNEGVSEGVSWALCWGLIFVLIGGLKKGGMAFIKHYLLRAILIFKGYNPISFVNFLDYAAQLIFLKKVGGGYIFIHRIFLEYFADLYKNDKKI